MKSARPLSAHAQKGSSPGSGEMFGRAEAGTSSASLSQQIDYLPDEWTPDAQPCQDSFVFQKNLVTHQPDKRVPFNPVPEQFSNWVLGRDLR
jgi:hypothetical protein